MMPPENRLPTSILEKAIRSGNEFGWRQSDVAKVVELSEGLNMAIIGGQIQYKLPDGTCELYWLSYDPAERQKDESWVDYCKRTSKECLEKLRNLTSKTNFEKEAIEAFDFLKKKVADGTDISKFLIFILYFDDTGT